MKSISRFSHPLIVLSFICLVTASIVDARTVQRLSFDRLISEADLIVRGRVEKIKNQQAADGRSVTTVVTVSVDRQFKGPQVSSVDIEQPGGSIGEMVQAVPGSPEFSSGEDVVLFLKRQRGGTFKIVGGKQGKFTAKIQPQSNNWVVEDFARRTESLDSFLDRLTSMVKPGG
jgi:hypothetical protein